MNSAKAAIHVANASAPRALGVGIQRLKSGLSIVRMKSRQKYPEAVTNSFPDSKRYRNCSVSTMITMSLLSGTFLAAPNTTTL